MPGVDVNPTMSVWGAAADWRELPDETDHDGRHGVIIFGRKSAPVLHA
jgi:hypothetical protein